MRVSIGSDHRGLEQRKVIAGAIEALGHEVDDLGTYSTESCDYPDIAAKVAQAVASGASQRGVLVCGTGIGVSIAANKFSGIRAAVVHDLNTAKLSRQHNDANILCLPGDSLDAKQTAAIVEQWLTTDFEGGRHARRVEKIRLLEEQQHSATGSGLPSP